eukprot:604773-Amphidinium_carterae.1
MSMTFHAMCVCVILLVPVLSGNLLTEEKKLLEYKFAKLCGGKVETGTHLETQGRRSSCSEARLVGTSCKQSTSLPQSTNYVMIQTT